MPHARRNSQSSCKNLHHFVPAHTVKSSQMSTSPQGLTRVIAQAANHATLLIDNISKTITMPSPGVVLYVAFLKGATKDDVRRAVEEIVSAKVFPLQSNFDFWKQQQSAAEGVSTPSERPKPMSLLECESANVLIIPQATLAGKLKAKAVQYHGQCDKSDAESHFYEFCRLLRDTLGANSECDRNGVPLAGDEISSRVVLNGTFGNRQALDMSSSGPFTHVFDF